MNKLITSVVILWALTASAWTNANFKRSATDFVKEITIGINIGNTLDVPLGNETEWGNVKITPELFKLYKAKRYAGPNGKGLGVELQFVSKNWGANKPLKCTVSPIEIK